MPWLTVVPFAVAMAYADGFWMITMRGAVGAIERTPEPFTTWLRESTLMLPIFGIAVLGALTLALRWLGPELRTPGAVITTALLVAAAGSVVGLAAIVVSAAQDYHLQSEQLELMGSMHGTCSGDCLETARQASIASMVRAGMYVGGLLLATNLVLVGWLVAMRGGRLRVTTNRPAAVPGGTGGPADGGPAAASRFEDVRLLLLVGLLGAAHIHLAVVPEHLTGWGAAGLFLLLLAAADIGIAAMLIRGPRQIVLIAVVVVCVVPLALWVYSRTAGLPFGPNAGQPASVGLPGIVVAALETTAVLAALLMLRRHSALRERPPASAHVRALVGLSLITVALIGIAGTAPNWFDQPGSFANPPVSHPHA